MAHQRRRGIPVPLCVLLVALAGMALACSGSVNFTAPAGPGGSLFTTAREALVEKDIALQEEAATVLAAVQDQPSLNNARPKLTELTNKHQAYKGELQKMTPATIQETQEIMRKFGDRSKVAKGNLAKEMTRVNSTIPGGGDVYRQLLELWQGL
jgi:hypothetical protein